MLLSTYAHLIDEYEDRERIDAEAEIAKAGAKVGSPQVRRRRLIDLPLEPRPATERKPDLQDIRASTATGIRTRVSAVRGRRPSPLDDSGVV